MNDALLKSFLDLYDQLTEDPHQGPDPSFADLEALEESFAGIVTGLNLLEVESTQRVDLLGKRMPDLGATMIETAAGLRSCPQIKVNTDPALFEFVAEQDLAIGGLVYAMQT